MDKIIQCPFIEKVESNGKEYITEIGCSIPFRFLNSDGNITTFLPEKQNEEKDEDNG